MDSGDMKVRGCIDLGSSYFRLLVVKELDKGEGHIIDEAEGETGNVGFVPYLPEDEPVVYKTEVLGRLFLVTESRRFIGWGRYLERESGVDRAYIEVACKKLKDLIILASRSGCQEPVLVGTNLLREASNSFELRVALEECTGLKVNVLSQKGEAEFGFRGAITAVEHTGGCVTVDLGGTSTEIAYGWKGAFEDFISIPVGAQRIVEVAKDPFLSHSVYRRFVIDGLDALMKFIGGTPFFQKLLGLSNIFPEICLRSS